MAINRTRPNGTSGLKAQVEKPIVGDLPQARAPKPRSPEAPESGSPRYLTMERFDARLRSDQMDALAALRRRLTRNRTDRSERITENTLLRVAVDLLLQNTDRLSGETEEQLAASVLQED